MREEDINGRAVALGMLAILVAIGLAAAIAALAWRSLLPAGSATGPDGRLDFAIRGARLQSAPQDERRAYFVEKNALINSYQWLDRERGIARIPVQEAMRMLAQRQEQQQQQQQQQQRAAGSDSPRMEQR